MEKVVILISHARRIYFQLLIPASAIPRKRRFKAKSNAGEVTVVKSDRSNSDGIESVDVFPTTRLQINDRL